jgi:polysaccharide biosynthesis/export protein
MLRRPDMRDTAQPFDVLLLGRGALPALLLAAACVFVVGCQSSIYQASSLPPDLVAPPARDADRIDLSNLSGLGSNSSLIGPGDLVSITIASGNDERKPLATPARVSDTGVVDVPMIGEVPIAGVEPFAASERIAQAAVERGIYRQPTVVVTVEEPAVNRVTVIGAVVEPGVKKVPRSSSDVLSAIAMAGGLSRKASTNVEVMRQNSQSFMASQPGGGEVALASYNDTSGATPVEGAAAVRTSRLDLARANPQRQAEYRVNDGDVIMVLPEKDRVIHVSGLVNTPNQFKIPRSQDVHVLDAIAMAGGVKSPVADKVVVIRRIKDKPEPAVIQVSIAAAKKEGSENIRLAPGDMVSVEQTPATLVVDTVTNIFNVGLGLGGNVAMF